jgi:hypothetical protein
LFDENIFRILIKYLPPWGVKFNEEVLVLLEFFIEILVSKNEDTLIGLNGRDEAHSVGGCEHKK